MCLSLSSVALLLHLCCSRITWIEAIIAEFILRWTYLRLRATSARHIYSHGKSASKGSSYSHVLSRIYWRRDRCVGEGIPWSSSLEALLSPYFRARHCWLAPRWSTRLCLCISNITSCDWRMTSSRAIWWRRQVRTQARHPSLVVDLPQGWLACVYAVQRVGR
jgi:hypothetical protein